MAVGVTAPFPTSTVTYTVKPGDTLIGLGKRYFATGRAYAEVQRTNHIRVDRHLRPGSTLTIPGSLLKSEPIDATVAAFSGAVTVDVGKGPITPTANMTLGQGAVISTGANAFVTLQLPDDSRISLPSQSRLRITRLRHIFLTDGLDRVFAVEQGHSESTVTPMTNPKSRYLITTPVASSAVRGTVFRAGFDTDAKAQTTEVVKGLVGVEGASPQGGQANVPQGFGAKTPAAGPPLQVQLLPAPKVINGGKDQEEPQVAFAIEPIPGARLYHLQLANDAGFVDIFNEVTVPAPTVTFDKLPDGTYFLRATAIDQNGLEGLPSTYSFTRQLNSLAGGPPQASGDAKMRRFLFRWTTAGAGVKRFRFQLFDGPNAKTPVVDEPGLSDPLVTVTDLKPGDYYWRVVVSTFLKGKVTDKAGEPQQLHIGG